MSAENAHVAEMHVIGAILVRPNTLDDITAILRPDDFVDDMHRQVYAAALRLSAANEPIDVLTVAESSGCDLATLGEYTMRLSGVNGAAYARLVRDASITRRLLAAAHRVAEIAGGEQSAAEKIDAAQSLVMSLADQAPTQGPQPVQDVLARVVDQMDQRFNSQGKIIGLSTGFPDLDRKTAGLQPADLVILAARPSMGKTTLAMNIARNVAIEGGKVLVFSLEMAAEQLLDREVAAIGGIEYEHIRTGRMGDEDWPRYSHAVGRLNKSNLHIDDSAALTITEIRARARRLHRKQALDLVVIDYLQLARGTSDNRTLEVQQISQGLKALAKELRCPVIALSQLNRALEQREKKRPRMSDLRDSGSIEQDADLILFLYRDEVYDENSPYKGTAELIIGKQRNGPIGKVPLIFQGHLCRFESFQGEWQEHEQPKKSGRWSGGFEG